MDVNGADAYVPFRDKNAELFVLKANFGSPRD